MKLDNIARVGELATQLAAVRASQEFVVKNSLTIELPCSDVRLSGASNEAITSIIIGDLSRQEVNLLIALEELGVTEFAGAEANGEFCCSR